jgi:hypothetical protein
MPDSTADEKARNYWRALAAAAPHGSAAQSEALAVQPSHRQRAAREDEMPRERLNLSA